MTARLRDAPFGGWREETTRHIVGQAARAPAHYARKRSGLEAVTEEVESVLGIGFNIPSSTL